MGIWEEIKDSYRWGSVLTRLIYINIAVFVILRLVQTVLTLTTGPYGEADYPLLLWLSLPSDPATLIFRPWTLITYMFVHYNFLHVLFNLLYLYWFGKLFLEFLKPRQLLGVYLLGGLAGALLYLFAFNLIPSFYSFFPSSILMGASASVMAILFAVSTYRPNHTIYLLFIGAARLKYIALAALLIDLISIPTLDNTGGHLAHLGGALMGYLYAQLLLKNTDITKPITVITTSVQNLFKPRTKLTVAHKKPLSDMEYNALKVKKQQEVDRVLEKIKTSGYESLTQDEKKTLFEASKD